ncbi:MAG: hypothetical protein OEV17_11035 [Nitrospira sp.]|nr:hypothetical protein [Nitrospira sp.]
MAMTAKDQTDFAAALVRLYVFLTQYLDRSVDDAARASYPEAELQSHLAQTRQQLMDVLSVNPVVKQKLAEECDRILSLGDSCVKSGSTDKALLDAVQAERTVLRNKTIALSDLVAVFRAWT